MNHYEIRTARGTPVLAFDDETRARQAMIARERAIGTKLQLFRVRVVEERL